MNPESNGTAVRTGDLLHDVVAGFGAGRLGRELVGTIFVFILLWWMLGRAEGLLP